MATEPMTTGGEHVDKHQLTTWFSLSPTPGDRIIMLSGMGPRCVTGMGSRESTWPNSEDFFGVISESQRNRK